MAIFMKKDIQSLLENDPKMLYDLSHCHALDGYGNNVQYPNQGSMGEDARRDLFAHYLDEVEAMPRMEVNARLISNVICHEDEVILNSKGASDWLWAFGQFIDHDTVRTLPGNEVMNIELPENDILSPDLDFIGFTRTIVSQHPPNFLREKRQQKNIVTSYLDLSQTYGSSDFRAKALRTKSNFWHLGKLKGTNLMPKNEIYENHDYLFNGAPGLPSSFFLSGDDRVNEVATLTAIHNLFYLEHNRLAELISQVSKEKGLYLDSDSIFYMARMINVWQYQSIIFNQYLPALIGDYAPKINDMYYDLLLDASTSNEFATAGFRLGHTLISNKILLAYKDNTVKEIALRDAFFNPTIVDDEGIDPILKGLAIQRCRDIDTKIVDDLRNFLFTNQGQTVNALDLASLNIQRGRDHGIPGYNYFSSKFQNKKLDEVQIETISSDPAKVNAIKLVYGDINLVDPWVGMLCEDKELAVGSLCGKSLSNLLKDTFTRLSNGDRCFHAHHKLDKYGITAYKTTLKEIIIANTNIGSNELKSNVFFV